MESTLAFPPSIYNRSALVDVSQKVADSQLNDDEAQTAAIVKADYFVWNDLRGATTLTQTPSNVFKCCKRCVQPETYTLVSKWHASNLAY